MNRENIRLLTAIKEYICRKSYHRLEPRATIEELKDYLNYLSRQYNIIDLNGQNLGESIKLAVNDAQCNVNAEGKDKPLLALNNNTVDATYNLIHLSWLNTRLDDAIDKFLNKRKLALKKEKMNEAENYFREPNQMFCENTAALLVQNLFETIIRKDYILKGMWPIQCTDIYQYLLDIDLAKIMGLPSLQNRLVNFYQTVKENLWQLTKQANNLIFSNDDSWILARNNMDRITSSKYINNQDNNIYYTGDFLYNPSLLMITIFQQTNNYEIQNNLWCPYKEESGTIFNEELRKLSRTLNQKIK